MASKHSAEKWSSVTAQVRFPDRPVWSFVGRGHDWRSLCPLRVESGGKTVKRVAVENPLSRGGHTQVAVVGAFSKKRWQACFVKTNSHLKSLRKTEKTNKTKAD